MQFTMFDGSQEFKIDKPIRLIELFAGYGSQHLALNYLGVECESYKICEWAVKSIQAYKDMHFADDDTDYSKDLTKEQIIDYLANRGISANYNEPMTYDQVKRMGEEKCRQVYNNIKATHNLVNIQQAHAEDFEIVDRDKYCYVMTYSFPCQDLSKAGLGKGMEKGSGTRSGMLWEVERILDECNARWNLPQVLLMENVPDVIGTNNIKHFAKWLEKLESLGYHCYWQVLNGKDYGVPQNRERCFMVSVLGDYYYDFPQPIKLEHRLKDLLEDDVDEKYYLSDKIVSKIKSAVQTNDFENNIGIDLNDTSVKTRHIANTIKARYDCGYEHFTPGPTGVLEIKEQNLKTKLCNNLIQSGILKESDVINHSYTNGLCGKNPNSRQNLEDYIETNNIMPTLTTRPDVLGVVVNSMYSQKEIELFTDDGNIRRYINSDIIDKFEEGQMATITYPNGYGHGPRTHNESIALNTIDRPSVKNNYRIRKLTPKECFRLMGVKDQDFERVAQNQSNASLYHLAGDSIIVDVLMAIFKQMIKN